LYSYGYRPKKNSHQAIQQAVRYANAGKQYVVDVDLRNFFDRVQHDYLMSLLSRKISDKMLLKLIRSYLESGILIDGVTSKRTEGTPQGSPLCPLLSNILLNELDQELERRGHAFVRYADDFSIYVKTKRSAYRVKQSVTRFIKRRLHLEVNQAKSGVRYAGHLELLGYKLYRSRRQQIELKVSERSWEEFKRRCKMLTRKSTPMSMTERTERLQALGRGWLTYFRLAHVSTRLKELDHWLGSRLRYCIWKSWKRLRTRIWRLKHLGLPLWKARKWGVTRLGGWRIVHTPILTTTLTNEYLQTQGFVPMLHLLTQVRRDV
jgi:group II intron reverse transcriptase/maturase